MAKLLKFEFRKLYQMKAYWISCAIAIVMTLISILMSYVIVNNQGDEVTLDISIYSSLYFINSSMNASMIVTISAIFISIFTTEDTNQMTLKNIVSRGYNKTEIYFSKYLISLISIIAIYFVCIVVSYFGGTFFASTYVPSNFVLSMVSQLILLITYHALYFNIAIIANKLSSAISLCIVGPMVLSMVLSILDTILKFDSFKLSNYYLDSLNQLIATIDSTIAIKIIVTSFIYI